MECDLQLEARVYVRTSIILIRIINTNLMVEMTMKLRNASADKLISLLALEFFIVKLLP